MKNKNNILIIFIVTLSALTVIALVLITGFAVNGNNRGGSESSVPDISLGDGDASEDSLGGGSEASDISDDGSSSSPDNSSDDISVPSGDEIGQKIASLASALIGTPFADNGETPSGFDNSGFIYYVLRENGYITCPRTTEAQSRMGASVGRDKLKPGDLVFFGNDGSNEADFGGIYIGNGMMVACLMPDTNVKEVDITTDYYDSNFVAGVSLS